MRQGCQEFLTSVLDTNGANIKIETILVVNEFLDVFPEDLPGLPPDRDVEFAIDVIPGGDHEVRVDAEQVEDIAEDVELFAAIGTKVKPRLWVKKHESQACDRDKFKCKSPRGGVNR